jgi:hypothetical protein
MSVNYRLYCRRYYKCIQSYLSIWLYAFLNSCPFDTPKCLMGGRTPGFLKVTYLCSFRFGCGNAPLQPEGSCRIRAALIL